MAQAISESIKAPLLDIEKTSSVAKYDMLIVGTPVNWLSPTVEIIHFLKSLPRGDGKKAILFCTYRVWRGTAFMKMSRELEGKGYEVVLRASKKNVTSRTNFADCVADIRKALCK